MIPAILCLAAILWTAVTVIALCEIARDERALRAARDEQFERLFALVLAEAALEEAQRAFAARGIVVRVAQSMPRARA